MSFTTISPDKIVSGATTRAELFRQIKDNLDDLDVRLGAANIQTVFAENYIANQTASVIQLGDATAGTFTSYLPSALENQGIPFVFKKVDSTITSWVISGISGALIDGAATYHIENQYDSAALVSDGTNWFIVNKIDTTNLVTGTRRIDTTAPLSGGGDLSTNRTLSLTNVTNTSIDNSAGIVYSKLNLNNSILNADINSSAAIVYSKLSLSNSILNADINTSAAIAYGKLNLAGSIVNNDVSTSAAIPWTKFAAMTANKAVVTDASGYLTTSATTATELGYIAGVTSSIQTQIGTKWSKYSDNATHTNHTTWYSGSAAACLVLGANAFGGLVEVNMQVDATTDSNGSFLLLINETSSGGTWNVTKVSYTGEATHFGATGANVTFTVSGSTVYYQWGVASPAGFVDVDLYARSFTVDNNF